MMKYELWKIFSKSRNRIAVILMLILCVVIGIMTVNRIEYVDENGNSSTGIVAARNLRSAKNQWSGYLTEEVFQKALRKNRQIDASKEARSDDIQEQNKAFAKGQENHYFKGLAGFRRRRLLGCRKSIFDPAV